MIRSTNFQILVWKEITKIPVGKTITYKQLAKKLVSLMHIVQLVMLAQKILFF